MTPKPSSPPSSPSEPQQAQACPLVVPARTPEELSADAWDRIAEAMHLGAMQLPGGRIIVLGPDNLVKLTQWLATLKAKRPKAVMKAEDFQLQVTKQETKP